MLPFLCIVPAMTSLQHHFEPDGARARAMDARSHALLADSLEHIQAQAAHVLGAGGSLERVVSAMRSGARFGPYTFGLYYKLALALMEERPDDARQLAERLTLSPQHRGPLVLRALDDLPADQAALYQELMDTDPQTRFGLQAPPPSLALAFRDRFKTAFATLQKVSPDLASEFSGLIRDVCMVVGDRQARYQFDGGSSYMLWGGLFLNIESHETNVQLVEVLAHESGHSLLFGHSLDEALVLNEDDELYTSPLRVDPRPMDGIYHATYVSARMHWVMTRLLESGELSDEERTQAERARLADTENFEAGHEVVSRHGRLTRTGQAVMAEARRYMDGVRAQAAVC